jgi:Hemerythrin HHE cation binding domain
MSQPGPHRAAQPATANEAAARAVVDHHAQLAEGFNQRVDALLHLVDSEYLLKAEQARQDLLGYLRREILPHAHAEERVLYPVAASLAAGRLLVDGMVEEHRALTALVQELASAGSLLRAAAAGRALAALFAVHLAKENDLVLPLLVATPGVALAEVLAGMHELLGAGDAPDDEIAGPTAQPDGECGGGGCGCGGDGGAGPAAAPVHTVDTRVGGREVAHSQRHVPPTIR